jgi:outer membrane protein W
MNRNRALIAVVVLVLLAVPAFSQEWTLDSNQLTLGLGQFVPKSDVRNVDFSSASSFTVDYRYFFAKYWAFGFDYQYAHLEASGKAAPWYTQEVTRNLPVHNLTGKVQFRFPTGKPLEPYVGAGFNFMGTVTDSGKVLYPDATVVTPKGDFALGTMLQAGLDWRLASYWVLNFDVRYVDNSLTMEKWRYDHGVFYRSGTYDLDIKPMIYSVSFGWRW